MLYKNTHAELAKILCFVSFGFIATIARDYFLNDKVDNAKFVMLITWCSLLTSPLGEYAKFGIRCEFIVKRKISILLFATVTSLLVLFTTKNIYAILFINVLLAVMSALLIGVNSAANKSLIRIISPIFPLLNISLVWIGFTDISNITTLSYLLTFVLVLVFTHTSKKINVSYKYESVNWRGLIGQYLFFYMANTMVLINIYLVGNLPIYVIRFPIYVYSALMIISPYLKLDLKRVAFGCLCIILLAPIFCKEVAAEGVILLLTLFLLGKFFNEKS